MKSNYERVTLLTFNNTTKLSHENLRQSIIAQCIRIQELIILKVDSSSSILYYRNGLFFSDAKHRGEN